MAASGIGALLKRARQREGLTLREMGKRLGFSAAHLCELEKGNKLVSPERAVRMARELGLDPQVCVEAALQDLLDQQGVGYRVFVAPAR